MKVYILFSEKLKKFYVGHTNDLLRRLFEHNSGHSNFTRKGMPWILIHDFECKNRTEAIILEKKIKKRGIKRFLDDLNIR